MHDADFQEENIAVLLLAAGASQRLGRPKQLLRVEGRSLLYRMAGLGLGIGPTVVVLGAGAEALEAELQGLPVKSVYNENWQEGLAASIRAGLEALQETDYACVLLLLTDQPHVSAALLRQLVAARQAEGRGIAACQYAGQVGVPALFSRKYSSELLQLRGDTGAKRLIRQYAHDCAWVPFPAGATDLDTPEDVARWQENASEQPA